MSIPQNAVMPIVKTSLTASVEFAMPVLVITEDALRAKIAENAVVKLDAERIADAQSKAMVMSEN